MSSQQGPRTPAQTNSAQPSGSTSEPEQLKLTVAADRHVGQVRPHNEDYVDYYVPPEPEELTRKGALYMVADGMGGHSAGEVASRNAVDVVRMEYYTDATYPIPTSLTRAFRAANQKIYEQAQSDPTKSGMGTTLVAAVIVGRKVYVANVGDSRAYVINSQGVSRITSDHSWVEEQMRAGLLTPEQAKKHPQRNVVTRALGAKPSVEVDLFEGELHQGDVLVLCTDGLTGHVEGTEIGDVVRRHPPDEAVDLLIDLANSRGGSDNIGIVIVSAADGEAVVATVVAPPEERTLMQRIIRSMAALAVILFSVLILLGGYYLLTRGDENGTTPAVEPPGTADQVQGVLPTSTLAEADAPADQGMSTGEVAPVESPGPEETPAPGEPTATLKPTSDAAPTQASEPAPTTAPAAQTPRPRPTSTPRPPAPSLVAPPYDDKEELQGPILFEWNYSTSLQSYEAFQVLIWRPGEEQHNGAAGAVTETQQSIDLDAVDHLVAGAGTYRWTVVVVRKDKPEERLSEEAPYWEFKYAGRRGGGGGEPEH